MIGVRSATKQALALMSSFDRGPAVGATILTYHRVGGGTRDELDVTPARLAAQLDRLVDGGHDVVSLDEALDRLEASDNTPAVVLTFDDGFVDVFTAAWPLLRERQLPFTIYLTAGLVGGTMRWEGSAAASQGAPAVDWDQVATMHQSGLCTVANHTWNHPAPDEVDVEQLDRCSDDIERRLGERPAHFAWTWGVPVPELLPAVRERFRSVATGEVGRNSSAQDRWALRRVPVRRTDPPAFFDAKLRGELVAERAYGALVGAAKRVREVGGRG